MSDIKYDREYEAPGYDERERYMDEGSAGRYGLRPAGADEYSKQQARSIGILENNVALSEINRRGLAKREMRGSVITSDELKEDLRDYLEFMEGQTFFPTMYGFSAWVGVPLSDLRGWVMSTGERADILMLADTQFCQIRIAAGDTSAVKDSWNRAAMVNMHGWMSTNAQIDMRQETHRKPEKLAKSAEQEYLKLMEENY